jgi:Arc/MetJ family transcription regulator
MIFLCIIIIRRRNVMRTTLDLPEDLLQEAMQATQIQTKTKVIITALEELVRKSKISGLKKFKGKVDLEIDLDLVRGRECRF